MLLKYRINVSENDGCISKGNLTRIVGSVLSWNIFTSEEDNDHNSHSTIRGIHNTEHRQEVGLERSVFPVYHGKSSTTAVRPALVGYILQVIWLKH